MFFSSSKREQNNSAVLHCQCSGQMFSPMGTGIEPTSSPGGNVALTTGIPSGTENKGLHFRSIANTESRRAKFLKPCGRTTQFSAGLHCQAQVFKQLFFKWYEE